MMMLIMMFVFSRLATIAKCPQKSHILVYLLIGITVCEDDPQLDVRLYQSSYWNKRDVGVQLSVTLLDTGRLVPPPSPPSHTRNIYNI